MGGCRGLLAGRNKLAGRAADRGAVTTLVATVTGYFLLSALRPPPPGLPTVREFQAAQGVVALRWLQHRTGWP